MRFNDVIYLLSEIIEEDALGNQTEVHAERKVYANEFDVGSAEFYNAAVNGLKASNSWQIHAFEYHDEEQVKHNGERYNIIRTSKRGDMVRLVCEKVTAHG